MKQKRLSYLRVYLELKGDFWHKMLYLLPSSFLHGLLHRRDQQAFCGSALMLRRSCLKKQTEWPSGLSDLHQSYWKVMKQSVINLKQKCDVTEILVHITAFGFKSLCCLVLFNRFFLSHLLVQGSHKINSYSLMESKERDGTFFLKE